jgi:hypothetical protein
MSNYGNHLPACSGGGLRLGNSSKSKTMTFNLIARKNLFRLSEYLFSLALWWERAGVMTLSRGFVIAWERCLDARDKLR